MNSLPQVKACGVLVLRGDPVDSFLLMKHHKRWDLPKGHIEAGETDTQCALREMEEETGIPPDAVVLDPIFRFTTEYRVREKHLGGKEAWKTVIIFLGRLLRDVKISTTEHPDFAWHPFPAAPIQRQTIDPLLISAAEFLRQQGDNWSIAKLPPAKSQ